MNPVLIQTLLVLAPFVFGAGVSTLLYRLFDIVIQRLPVGDLLKNLFTVLGWFLGNGAIVFGTFKTLDLDASLKMESANGVAVLCYLAGFGAGLFIPWGGQNSLFRDMHKYLDQREIDVLLMLFRYDIPADEAAKRLNMTEDEVNEVYASALKKLQQRGKHLLEAFKKRQGR